MISNYNVMLEASNDITDSNKKQKREAKEIIEYRLPTP